MKGSLITDERVLDYAKSIILSELRSLPETNQELFKRIFSYKDTNRDLGEIVKGLQGEHIQGALSLLQRTINP